VTITVARVLRALLDDPTGEHYGFDLMEKTGLGSGTVYPILGRLENGRWIDSYKENINPIIEKRPARRYYTLTTDGAIWARQALAELAMAITPVGGMVSPRIRPHGGFA
jgi:PadR family transcriptional regulator PadR